VFRHTVRHPISIRALVLAFAAFLLVAAPAGAQRKKPPRKPPVKVQILGINDFHGHLEATTPGLVARSEDPLDRVPAGGAEFLATHIRTLARRYRNTAIVSAGDLVGGSPLLSSLFHDEPTIEAMNEIGLDFNAVGNHEFDEGANELRRMQRGGCHPVEGCRDGTPFGGARFRFLAANVKSRRTGRTIFRPYGIRKFEGVKVAFIGMTLESTPEMVPPYISSGLRFADEARTANRLVRRLKRREGVEAIVVLLHEGGHAARPGGPDDCPGISGPVVDIVRHMAPEVDAVLTGHTHAMYRCVIDGRPVTSAGDYGRLITRVKMRISRRTRDVIEISTDNWIVHQDVMRAPDMTALIQRYTTFAAPLRDRLIGRLARSAGRTADPSGESRMGNLVADAQSSAVSADAAFVNPGGVRVGLAAGDVTFGDAFRAQPFGASLVTMWLNGGQLLELLKQQWCGRERPLILPPSHGVSYTWSASAAAAATGVPCATAPNPVTGLSIHGAPVDPLKAYKVVVTTLLADGGNGFTVLRLGSSRGSGPGDTAALEAHLAPSLSGVPLVPPARDRITRLP
jgi:5'-nucleotidase